jgi:hypothetical protein
MGPGDVSGEMLICLIRHTRNIEAAAAVATDSAPLPFGLDDVAH